MTVIDDNRRRVYHQNVYTYTFWLGSLSIQMLKKKRKGTSREYIFFFLKR